MNFQAYNNLLRTCNNQVQTKPLKKNSAGNDPTISKAMRYSQYIRIPGNAKPRTEYNPNPFNYSTPVLSSYVNVLSRPDDNVSNLSRPR